MFFEILNLIILFLVVIIFLEILIALFLKLKNNLFYKIKGRKDFLDHKYHNYLKRYESLNPIFRYLPIGIRYFNFEDEGIKEVQNNSLGFRCPEFTEKNNNTFRVILLGGSAAWGSGASNNENTISGHLEIFLKEKLSLKKKIEIFNLAQINNYISQDLVNANLFFEKLRPDLVISFAGWNEIAASYLIDQNKLKKYRTFFMEEVGEIGPFSLKSFREKFMKKLLLKYLTDNSKILSLFNKKKSNANLFNEKKFLKEIELASSIFVEHMKKFELMSQGYKFKYIQFLQPHLYKKKKLTDVETKITQLYDFVRPVHGGISFGEFLKNNSIYEEIQKKIQIHKNLKCHNLETMFENNDQNIFFTLVHMNDTGYKLVAKKISEIVSTSIKEV